MDINLRLTALAEDIAKLEGELKKLQSEEWELRRALRKYYVGYVVDDDGNYCHEEIYYRLGFCTEEDAKEWADKQEECNDGPYSSADYFEVTKDEDYLYYLWESISDALDPIGNAEHCLRDMRDLSIIDGKDVETLVEFSDWLEGLEDRIKEALGKTHSWQSMRRSW